MSNFTTRLISGIVMVLVLIGLLLVGGDILNTAIAIISIIGMFELNRVLKVEKSPLGIVGYIFCAIYYLNVRFDVVDSIAVFLAFLIVTLGVYVFSYPKYQANQVMGSFFGLFYVAVMLSYIVQLRNFEAGQYLVWLIFLCSWGCDTCAYCVGMLSAKTIGTHKMAPVLSPKKSIEGAIGGIVGASLLTVLYSSIFKAQMGVSQKQILFLAIVTAVGAFISMIGDLAASAIKRNYDIKDYGKLIPGHGGILDRFDSVIITAPLVYFMVENLLALF